jgi:hypothetical protein
VSELHISQRDWKFESTSLQRRVACELCAGLAFVTAQPPLSDPQTADRERSGYLGTLNQKHSAVILPSRPCAVLLPMTFNPTIAGSGSFGMPLRPVASAAELTELRRG